MNILTTQEEVHTLLRRLKQMDFFLELPRRRVSSGSRIATQTRLLNPHTLEITVFKDPRHLPLLMIHLDHRVKSYLSVSLTTELLRALKDEPIGQTQIDNEKSILHWRLK